MTSNDSSPNTVTTDTGSDTLSMDAVTVFSEKEMKKQRRKRKKRSKKGNELAAREQTSSILFRPPETGAAAVRSAGNFSTGSRSLLHEMLSMERKPQPIQQTTSNSFEPELSFIQPKSAMKIGKYDRVKRRSSVAFMEDEKLVSTYDDDLEEKHNSFDNAFEDEENGLGENVESNLRRTSSLGEKRKERKKEKRTDSFMKRFMEKQGMRNSERNPSFESLRNMSTSTRFISLTERGQIETYPADCYSFLAIHSPLQNPFFFCFGFTVFVFQVLFLFFMVMSQIAPNYTNMGEIDNPSETWVARFIPSNVTSLVRATQVTALLSYCMFADSSLKDCIMAVELFPRMARATKEDMAHLQVFACLLRFFQGLLAIAATLLLIITSDDVIDIILNFAAVNYISTLDESAFELAKIGKYGPSLEAEAKKIENKPIPFCIYRKYQHVRYIATVIPIMMTLMIVLGSAIYGQLNNEVWVTQTMRVQFQDSTNLQLYSGCYDIDPLVTHTQRRCYTSFDENAAQGNIGYCKSKRRWVLFKDVEGAEDPCTLSRDFELAYSATTDAFDVSTSFDQGWFSASGTPLDLYFFETENRGVGLKKDCSSFLNNGKCDISFNTLVNQYDGGDCCASTCTQSNCGANGITSAFGVQNKAGNGYPNCTNPDMVPLTIYLNDVKSSRDKSVLEVTEIQLDDYERERGVDFWNETPVTPLFIIDCDEKNIMTIYLDESMKHHSEVLMVADGAWCRIIVTNTASTLEKWDNDPIWWINFTVYHGNGTSDEIITGYSGEQDSLEFHRINECYFETLEEFVDVSRAYIANNADSSALSWLANDESVYSSCVDEFLVERFALATINYAAPIFTDSNSTDEGILWITRQQQCRWDYTACNEGIVEALTVRSLPLNGTIASSIGLLTGLRKMVYDGNGLTGTIPTEIGLLTQLTGLDIDNNKLTGTIPTELGHLRKMIELDLDQNNLNGTIPTEFGRMVNAREFDLIYNQLSGPIPTEIGKLKLMTTFAAEGNNLSGTIPSEVGNMEKIEGLNLANNNITGRIPPEIRNARSSLKDLLLKNNSMTGTIPSDVGRLTKLQQLVLDGNGFSGTLPSEVGAMASLSLLSIRENNLRGTLPTEIGLLTNLREIRLEGNALSGRIPVEIVLLERLQILTFDDGSLTGSIPSNIKTSSQCLLCEGQNYELKPDQNNDDKVYYENGPYGIVNPYSCRTLLESKQNGDGLWSANACNTLKNVCVTCGSGDDNDDNLLLKRLVIGDADATSQAITFSAVDDIVEMNATTPANSAADPQNSFLHHSRKPYAADAGDPVTGEHEYYSDYDVEADADVGSDTVSVHDLSVRSR